MRAKAQSERAAEQRQESPEEYAQTEVQQGISDVAARTGNTAKSTARMSYRKFRAMQEKRKNLTLQGSTQSASKPTEKEKVTVPTQTERREMFKKQRFRQKAIAAKTPAPQAPVPSSATPAPPPCRVQMQQRLKRQHLTREAVRRYLQKQTAATAAGNTAPIVTHAPKLPTISNKQATVEAISRGVHYIAAKIKALLSQTVRRAAQSLLALLGAGGVVLLLAMVIGAAAAVIGSPMGILFADESGDTEQHPYCRNRSRDQRRLRRSHQRHRVGAPGVQRNHHCLRLRGRSHMGKLLAGGAGQSLRCIPTLTPIATLSLSMPPKSSVFKTPFGLCTRSPTRSKK